MTHIITENGDGTTTIQIGFGDEGVELQGEITVKGGETEAQSYLPFYESDLRRNFAEKFPVPESTTSDEADGGMM